MASINRGLIKGLNNIISRYIKPIINYSIKILSIPTINPPGLNYVECTDMLSDFMTGLGFNIKKYDASNFITSSKSSEEPRINLVGSTKFGKNGKKVHIHSHYDVVPPGEGWRIDPFKPIVYNERIYGRGASDMKVGLVSSLFLGEILRKLDEEFKLGLNGELIISATPDEETGGYAGAGYLVEKGIIKDIDYTVMPEPTSVVHIWNAHKGCIWLKIIVRGKQAHSTMPNIGINAFEYMSRLVTRFIEYRESIENRVSKMDSYPENSNNATITIGGLSGSSYAINMVPGNAWFTIDRRVIPEEDFDSVQSEILGIINKFREENPEIKVDISEILKIKPTYIEQDHELIKLISSSIYELTRVYGRPTLSPGFLNTRYFIDKGMAAVAWGPGDLEQAHAVNEYIKVSNLSIWLKALTIFLIKVFSEQL